MPHGLGHFLYTLTTWIHCESSHACIIKFSFGSDKFLSNAIITTYMKTKSVQNGWGVFNAMNSWYSTSWNSLLCGPHDLETYDQWLRIFCKMLAEDFRPDVYNFASILRSNCTLRFFFLFLKASTCTYNKRMALIVITLSERPLLTCICQKQMFGWCRVTF